MLLVCAWGRLTGDPGVWLRLCNATQEGTAETALQQFLNDHPIDGDGVILARNERPREDTPKNRKGKQP